MKACAYYRVSGESQREGDGIPRQQIACQKYAEANHIEIVDSFEDAGVSGKTELENRHGLSACMRYVQDHGINLVLIECADRLARDLIVSEVCIREFAKIKVRVISASGGVDLTAGDDSNPTAKLVRQILAAVAEFDRCVISLKLRSAKERKRLADPSWHDGRKPYGEHEGEKEQLAVMRYLRGQNKTLAEIQDAMLQAGHLARSGRPWSLGAIHRILTRENISSQPS